MLRLSYFSRENHLRALLIAMAVFLAASLLMIAVADPAHARKRHQSSPIVFVSDRDGTGGEIYKMSASDGSNQIDLTNNTSASDTAPDWGGGRR